MAPIISTKAYDKMDAYARTVQKGEIGGLLLGRVNKYGDIQVKDAIILKQAKADAHFEIEESAMMDFTKNATEKQLSSIIGWWHSHGRFEAFWSTDDSKTFERLCKLTNNCFGIVVSTKDKDILNIRCRIDVNTKNGDYLTFDELYPIVDKWIQPGKYEMVTIDQKAILKDIQDNVTDVGEDFIDCPKCAGSGVIRKSYSYFDGLFKDEKYNEKDEGYTDETIYY